MKKIMHYTAKGVAVALVVAVFLYFNVGNEINDLFRTVAVKVVPWFNTIIYS